MNAGVTDDVPIANVHDAFPPVDASDSATLEESGRPPAMVDVDLTEISDLNPERACSDTAAERIPVDCDLSSLTPLTAQSYSRLGADQDIIGNMGFAISLQPTICLDAQAGLDFVLE